MHHGNAFACGTALWAYLLYQCIPLELLLRNLDSARAGNVVHAAFLEQVIQHVALIVESGSTNFTAVIKQIHTEQFPLAILVVPSFDI